MNFESLRASGFDSASLLSPAAALEAYFSRVPIPVPRVEFADLSSATGRILAAEIRADHDYPRADRSAMDGFAVRSADTPGRLRVCGTVQMGVVPAARLPERGAMRIPTGGVLPQGADAVVPVEDAALEAGDVTVPFAPAGDAINPQGSDMRCGATVLGPGIALGPAEIGVLATLGIVRIPVFARPRIGILSSGDELVSPDVQADAGQVRDSNRYAVAAALGQLGAQPVHLPTAPDDRPSLERHLRDGLKLCDAVVLTGGSSVGTRDFTPEVLASLGEVVVHGLRVKPGKPTVLGAVAGKPVIGLPGNPTSALAILLNVVAPIVARLTGASSQANRFCAVLGAPVTKPLGWTWFVPVVIEREPDGTVRATPLPMHSGHVGLLATANGFAVLEERVTTREAGTAVNVVLLSGGGLR